jgi:hypothetical protein
MRHLLLPLALCATTLHAQQATVASGGDATGTGGSASYSVGQPAYTTLSAAGGSVAQGVQQPYEISVSTGMDEDASAFFLTAAPNPATDLLELATAGPLPVRTRYHLRNTAGQLLATAPITSERTRIAMNGLAPGIYLLDVSSPDGPLRTFRIVKH